MKLNEGAERQTEIDPVDWIEKNFWIPEDNYITGERGPRTFDFQPYQRDVLREAFRKDERGLYVWSTILWSDIKKSGKSTICAGVALYMADIRDWAECYLIANDLKQAESRVAKYARRAVYYSPYLQERYKIIKNAVHGLRNKSIVEPLPIDPEGEAGSNADFIQFSELWGAMDNKKERMFSEMALSPTKFGQSLIWVESYAGFTDESEVLWELYETGVKNGELLWPDKLYPVMDGESKPLELYANYAARQLTLWNTVPRCPWQTREYYAQEESRLFHTEFLRMHRNQWTSNTDTFVPIEWWDACKREKLPNFDKEWPMIISADAAVSDDTFGLLMACRHPDRENYPDDVLIPYARCWKPPKGGKIDFYGTPDAPGPEMELRRLIDEYNIVEIAYDECQLYDMMSRMFREGLGFFRRFPQGGGKHSRLVADSAFRDKIREKRIWHLGQEDLRDHIQNADAQIDKEDRKCRIVKRVDKLKIDLAVCASMGAYEVHRLNL